MTKYLLVLFSTLALACISQAAVPTLANKVTTKANTPETQYALVCMSGELNFRSAPGTDQEVKYTFPDGTLVQVMDEVQTTSDGATWRLTEWGWVNVRYLCLEAK